MTAVAPNVLALYFKLWALIHARKWKAAREVVDALDAAEGKTPCP